MIIDNIKYCNVYELVTFDKNFILDESNFCFICKKKFY
jgi:hypothetical protein